jgi:hypothetical protein
VRPSNEEEEVVFIPVARQQHNTTSHERTNEPQHADSSSSHTGSADYDEWGDSEAEYALEPSVGTGENNNNNIKKEQALHGTNRQVGGVAVAAGIAGTLLVGPLVGLVVAGGAAVVATTGFRGQSRPGVGHCRREYGRSSAEIGSKTPNFLENTQGCGQGGQVDLL